MKVPQGLLDRRDELVAEVQHQERRLEIVQAAHSELEDAIQLIENEPDEAERPDFIQPEHTAPQPSAEASAPAANPSAPGQRAPKRDIKTLVLNKLTGATQRHTAKEIAKAIEAGIQSTEAALEHWKTAGVADEVDGKWLSVAGPRAVPRQAPEMASGGNGGSQPPAVMPEEWTPSVMAPATEEPSKTLVTTQDKMVQALKAAGAAGMTDDELAKVGIPYVSVMQYHRAGWLKLENNRYSLNQPQ